MVTSTAHPFFSGIPPDHRQALWVRLLIVWCVSLAIAVVTWSFQGETGAASHSHSFAVSLVYAYAISTMVWLFVDVGRFVLRRSLRSDAPNYWPTPAIAWVFVPLASLLGYVLGTWLGDSYAGRSTLSLLQLKPYKFWGILVSSLAISVAFSSYFFQRSKAEQLQRTTTEAQLRLLQSQLEPHMLFNTLANLRTLMTHDVPKAQAMLDQLIAFFRATLQASRQSHHSMREEFDRLADYLGLMQVRMGQRLSFTLDLPSELNHVLVPTLLLQPLVENSIRHGLEGQVEGGTVWVSAALKHSRIGATLQFTVQDNGVGIQALETLAPTHGHASPTAFGLMHVRQRLSSLYGQQAQLHIDTPREGGGTRVVLTLPIAN